MFNIALVQVASVRLQVILKTIKIVLIAPQPVLVIMSLSKGNALTIKRRNSYSGPPDKGGIIQRAGCLIRSKRV